jgi:fatty acid desaturase
MIAIRDPRSTSTPWYVRWALPLLADERDGQLVAVMAQSALLAVAGAALFLVRRGFWWGAAGYWAVLVLGVLDRFTLMLHCTSHRRLFHPRHPRLERLVPWVLGPFLGQTPDTYFAHHMGMHHQEENLPDDLSSTLRYRRDSLPAWLRYWARFMVLGLPELARYLARRGRHKLLRRVLVGEAAFWAVTLALLAVNPAATLVVLVGPVLLIRTLMMMGNWTQHAFVCPEQPANPYRASLTCLNTRYNRRCFNDGYHAVHHLAPRTHWTDHPAEFERRLGEHGRHDAVVLDGLDYFQVWLLLMTGRWGRLARAFVRLPGAPARSDEEVIALLRARVEPVPASVAAPAAADSTRDHDS